jgi:hypothetical protein
VAKKGLSPSIAARSLLTSIKDLIFKDVGLQTEDLLVTVFDHRKRRFRIYSWKEFQTIPNAMEAVVAAGWSCQDLQEMSQKVPNHQVSESDLAALRKDAKARRKRISIRNSADPVSAFE